MDETQFAEQKQIVAQLCSSAEQHLPFDAGLEARVDPEIKKELYVIEQGALKPVKDWSKKLGGWKSWKDFRDDPRGHGNSDGKRIDPRGDARGHGDGDGKRVDPRGDARGHGGGSGKRIDPRGDPR